VEETPRNGLRRALGPEVPLLDVMLLRPMLAELEAHDPGLAAHATEVARLARLVALELGWPSQAVGEAALAGALHDVGKLAIPPAVLNKPGPLTHDEWVLMRRHPERGAEMVGAHPGTARVGPAVRDHHERFDGRGYPDGRVGEQVPPVARLVAACDAYRAMREQRPYAEAMSAAAALNELWSAAGTQFDVDVVAALERVIQGERALSAALPGPRRG
jgi:putative nucleotidyltransferase with HDIG domain